MNPQGDRFSVDVIYYESHVTIKPVEGERLVQFEAIALGSRFNVATFTKDTAGPNSMICTGRDKRKEILKARMFTIVESLKKEGFEVTRYKLESTLLDSRWDDSELPLG